MELKFEVVDADQLEDGDIFYCTPDIDLNDFGHLWDLTGTDQILIKDDFHDVDEKGNYSIIVNGGRIIWFKPAERVVKIGHYFDLIRIIEMVKLGNPKMELGPNDIVTKAQDLFGGDFDLLRDLDEHQDE